MHHTTTKPQNKKSRTTTPTNKAKKVQKQTKRTITKQKQFKAHPSTTTTKTTTTTSSRSLITTAGSPRYTNQQQTEPRILITGACGQVGFEIAHKLRSVYNPENIICTDGMFIVIDIFEYL
jgi:FlaA1/EpsC-like NDP-sugar epimerase